MATLNFDNVKNRVLQFLAGDEEILLGKKEGVTKPAQKDGTVYFALKTDPLTNEPMGAIYLDIDGKRVPVSGSSYASVDLMGQEILKTYLADVKSNSNLEKFELLFYTGDGTKKITLQIPNASDTAAGLITATTQSISGAKTFEDAMTLSSTLKVGGQAVFDGGAVFSSKNFNYSGIESADADKDRSIWFSDSATVGKPVYNNNFKYNPSNNTLTVGNISGHNVSGPLSVSQFMSVSSTLSVGSDTTIGGTFTVSNNKLSSLGGDLVVKGNTSLEKDLSVAGDATVLGDFLVTKTLTANGLIIDTGIFNYKEIKNTNNDEVFYLWISSEGTLGTPLYDTDFSYNPSSNTLSVANIIGHTVTGDLNVNNTLAVTSNATVGGTFKVSGNTTLEKALSVGSTATLKGKTTVQNNFIVGTTSTARTVTVYGDSTFNGKATITDTLNYSGITTAANKTGKHYLWMSAETGVGTPLYDAELYYNANTDTLTLTNISGHTVSGDLTVSGSVNLSSSVSIGGNLKVTGTSEFSKLVTMKLGANITGPVSIVDSSDGKTPASLNVSGPISTDDNLTVSKNLKVDGIFNYYGIAKKEDSDTNNFIWFSLPAAPGTPYYDTKFTYNSSTDTLTVDNISGHNVKGKLNVTDATTISSTLEVGGKSTLKSDVAISGATTIAKTLIVSKATTLSDALSVTGAASLLSTLSVAKLATFNGGVSIAGGTFTYAGIQTATADAIHYLWISHKDNKGLPLYDEALYYNASNDTLYITNISGHSVNGNISITGTADISSTLNVGGAVTLGSTLTIAGNTIIGTSSKNATLTVNGNVTLNKKLSVVGAVTLSNTLNVSKAATFTDNVTINGDTFTYTNIAPTNLDKTYYIWIGSSEGIGTPQYDSNFSYNPSSNLLTVTNISGHSVQGDITITGALTVSSSTTLSGNVSIGGTLTVTKATALKSTLTVDSNGSIGGTLEVTGATTLSNTLSVKELGTFKNGLSVTGGTFNYSAITTASDKDATHYLWIGHKDNIGIPVYDASFSYNANSNTLTVPNINGHSVTGNLKVTGTTEISSTLKVGGKTTLNGGLAVAKDKATTLGGTLTVENEQATTLTGSLSVTGETTLSSALGVTGKATFGGEVAISGKVSVGGALEVTGATTLKDTLKVAKAATFESTLSTSDTATLQAAIVNTTLSVSSDTSIGGALSVGKTSQLTGNVTVGKKDTTSSLTVWGATILKTTLEVGSTATIAKKLTVSSGGASIKGGLTVEDTVFNYKTITSTNEAADHYLWIGKTGSVGVPLYDTNLSYNPSTDTLTVSNIKGHTVAGDLSITGNATVSGTITGTLSGNATSANKLNTDAGSTIKPVYFSKGIPVAVAQYSKGKACYSIVPHVGSDGVMEIGKYIDFHDGNDNNDDYSVRLTASKGALACSGGMSMTTITTSSNGSIGGTFTAGGDATFQSKMTVTGKLTASGGVVGDLTGTADKAKALTCGDKGSATVPVYFKAGVPVECTLSSVTGLLSTLTSTADANLTVKVAGTSKSINDLYASFIQVSTLATTNTAKHYLTAASSTSATGTSLYACSAVYIQKGVMYGAAWNDYAEYRETKGVQAGRVVVETGAGEMVMSTERLQPGANIVSDTFGFTIGQTKKNNTPIAVSGRVLAYPYEDRNSYKPGDAVCTGPDGTVSKMTREEIMMYPERIVGTVSEIPSYKYWGEGKVKVNNRIWIKVK